MLDPCVCNICSAVLVVYMYVPTYIYLLSRNPGTRPEGCSHPQLPTMEKNVLLNEAYIYRDTHAEFWGPGGGGSGGGT